MKFQTEAKIKSNKLYKDKLALIDTNLIKPFKVYGILIFVWQNILK